MRSYGIFAVALTAMVLGGCAAPNSTPTATASAETTIASPSASVTGKVATGAQYGSLVSPLRKDLAASVRELSNCRFEKGNPTLACTIRLSTANMQVMSIGLALQSAQNPAVPSYIGAPTGDVQTLVNRTQSAATAVESEYSQAGTCVSAPTGDGCAAKLSALHGKIGDFSGDLAAWSRYGG